MNSMLVSLRVAQILYHTCPLASEEGKESGGANVYVLKLSEELSKRGVQVDMFTRSEDENAKKVIELNKNLRLIHVKAGPEKTLPKKELINFIPEFVENLQKYVGREQYDILDCHYFMSGIAALSLLRTMNYEPRTLITFHTLGLIKNLVARSEAEMESEVRINAEGEIVKKFDAIIAPSTNERDYLHFLYGAPRSKIQIISPGYDEKLFKTMDKAEARRKIGADPEHKIILFVGRIEPLKGIDSLMYAMKILVEECPSCQICLWIVGGEKNQLKTDNQELQKLHELQKSLNLRTSVKFIDHVPQHELVNYYNAADVVVMPSHYESFGMTALEAMACETPVITTNIAGISGMLEEKHKAGVISAGNPILLAGKIKEIIQNGKDHDKLSAEIKKSIKDLTWGSTAEKVTKVYEGLLSFPRKRESM